MPSKRPDPVVFDYLDHRAYLADYFAHKRKRGLSYRGFSRRVGLGAPNYLKQVIDGDKRLSSAMAERFAAACDLEGDAGEYFCVLVAFNHAKDLGARNEHYARLSSFRRYREAQKLELAHAAYHSTWYLPAIRELVIADGFREDSAWIGDQLRPKVRETDVRKALTTLLELGLLVRDDAGRLRQSQAVVSTGPQTTGMHIANYHAEMMQHATRAMDLIPAAERDISSLTMCVNEEAFALVRERLRQLRRELIAMAESSEGRGQVMQLNLQLFPLTQSCDGKPARKKKPTGERS